MNAFRRTLAILAVSLVALALSLLDAVSATGAGGARKGPLFRVDVHFAR